MLSKLANANESRAAEGWCSGGHGLQLVHSSVCATVCWVSNRHCVYGVYWCLCDALCAAKPPILEIQIMFSARLLPALPPFLARHTK